MRVAEMLVCTCHAKALATRSVSACRSCSFRAGYPSKEVSTTVFCAVTKQHWCQCRCLGACLHVDPHACWMNEDASRSMASQAVVIGRVLTSCKADFWSRHCC